MTQLQKSFWDNGKLRSEIPKINGIVNGIEYHYFPNGKLSYKLPKISGRSNGVNEFWNDFNKRTILSTYNGGGRHGVKVYLYYV